MCAQREKAPRHQHLERIDMAAAYQACALPFRQWMRSAHAHYLEPRPCRHRTLDAFADVVAFVTVNGESGRTDRPTNPLPRSAHDAGDGERRLHGGVTRATGPQAVR